MDSNPNNIQRGDVVILEVYESECVVIGESYHYNGMHKFEVIEESKNNEKPTKHFVDAPQLKKHESKTLKPLKPSPPLLDYNTKVGEKVIINTDYLKANGTLLAVFIDIDGSMECVVVTPKTETDEHTEIFCSYNQVQSTGERITPTKLESGSFRLDSSQLL